MLSSLALVPIKEVIPSVETAGLELNDDATVMMQNLPQNNTSKSYTIIHFILSLSSSQPSHRVYEQYVVSKRFWFHTGSEHVATGNVEIALYYLACGIATAKFNDAISKPIEDKRFIENLEESCRYLVAAQKIYSENGLEIEERLLPSLIKGGFYHWIDVLFDYLKLTRAPSLYDNISGEFKREMKLGIKRSQSQKDTLHRVIVENLSPCVRIYKNLKSMTARIPDVWRVERDKMLQFIEKKTAVILAYNICFRLDPETPSTVPTTGKLIIEAWALLKEGGDIMGKDKCLYDVVNASKEFYYTSVPSYIPNNWNSIRDGTFFNQNSMLAISYEGEKILKEGKPLHLLIPEHKTMPLGVNA